MKTAFSVRRMRSADLPRILVIERASFGADAYDRNLFAEYARDCGGLFLVAEAGTKVVGYAITCIGGQPERIWGELVSLAVLPSVRGKGAAAALMNSILRRLRRRRIPKLALTVKISNARAISFYERYGFRRVRRIARYYEDAQDGWRYVKDL